ncbi:Uncharacterized protein AC507_2076 [Pseudomonas syringae pv. maculicola]|nr:Uncharacterized protein AC507_2076 [Pseudomonas syringae pv. maculicola]
MFYESAALTMADFWKSASGRDDLFRYDFFFISFKVQHDNS